MIGAGFGWLALLLAAGAAHAQDTNTVGNPQLKDFQLPGTRTLPPPTTQEQPAAPADQASPPPAAQPPAAAPPGAQTPAPPPPATTGTPPADAPAAAARPRLAPREAAPAQAQPSVPGPAPAAELPSGVPAPAELEQALPAPPPAAPKTEWQPPVTPAAAERSFPWLYVGLAALLALLSLLALVALKRSRASGADRVKAEAAPQPIAPDVDPAPAPDPLFAARSRARNAPVPAESTEPATSLAGAGAGAAVPAQAAPPAAAAAPSGIVGVSMRPRIELEFKANRAAATLTEAVVQYELIVRNAGNSAAQNVRLQAFMTNAGPEQDEEIGNFFSQSSLKEEPVAIPSLAPGTEAHVRSGLSLPRDQLREITVQGRRLFIPIVAFNVYYEWGQDRSGQTSMSYLVGREAPTPQEKMGAFRLDLGPRLYRSVGQRQANLAKVV